MVIIEEWSLLIARCWVNKRTSDNRKEVVPLQSVLTHGSPLTCKNPISLGCLGKTMVYVPHRQELLTMTSVQTSLKKHQEVLTGKHHPPLSHCSHCQSWEELLFHAPCPCSRVSSCWGGRGGLFWSLPKCHVCSPRGKRPHPHQMCLLN